MRQTGAVTATAPVHVQRPAQARAPAGTDRVPVRLAVAVASGLLLDVAFPPHDLWLLAPLAVGGLTLACRGARARTGALAGLAAGLALFVPMLVWTGTIAGVLAWLALALLEAAFFVPLGAALAVVGRL